MCASIKGHLDIVMYLHQHGADIHIKNNVSIRYVSPVCPAVHPLTSFCLTYSMESQLSCMPVERATWIL